MIGITRKLKRIFTEPKVYALVLRTKAGAVLHLGVHYSLDDALDEAAITLGEGSHIPGDGPEIEMWTSLDGQTLMTEMLPDLGEKLSIAPEVPSVIGMMGGIKKKKTPARKLKVTPKLLTKKEVKNELMKKLIAEGTVTDVKDIKGILSKAEKKLIIEKIMKRQTNDKSKN